MKTTTRIVHWLLHYADGEPKSLCRGWIHAATFIHLVLFEQSKFNMNLAKVSVTILYLMSHIFHVWNFQNMKIFRFVKTMDHIAILNNMGCIETLPAILLYNKTQTQLIGLFILTSIWLSVTISILYVIFKPNTYKMTMTGNLLYALSGSILILWFPVLYTHLPLHICMKILACYIIYAIGMPIYVLELFNIYPKVFGYHEWFHISSVIAGVIALDLHNELIDGLL